MLISTLIIIIVIVDVVSFLVKSYNQINTIIIGFIMYFVFPGAMLGFIIALS
ncbi:hypothetical protein [Chryseobacterium sp. FH2]|uniref:hypothetical protein n=1 Tax=Chryseobacterium sp. FH2 TaxID=1674291 RepID=UPI000AE01C3E|nr:hypothetical protein [Chryseobacterium sp. FH2]